MQAIEMNRSELAKLVETLEKFPDIEKFKIVKEGHSGLGYTLDVMLDYNVNGCSSIVSIEISGVENW